MGSELVDELARAARGAWDIYTGRHPGESVYAFGLYVVSEDGMIVAAAYATEEATARRAAEYEFMMGGDESERARVIRWWDADWAHCNDVREPFIRANELLRALPPDARIRECYVEAMSALGKVDAGVVHGVFGGDREAVERSVALLNSPEIHARFRRECEEAERAYEKLQR